MSRLLLALPLALVWLSTVAASPTPLLSVPPVASASPSASPAHSPTATPTSSGQLALSVALGPPGTTITIQGSSFRPNEPLTLYWDSTTSSLGQVTADNQGAFKLDIKAPAGDAGQHAICVIEPGQPPCAVFKLLAPTPSPSASATPSPTPTATATPAAAATPTIVPDAPAASNHPSAIAALFTPPFVIFPILIVLALLGGCAYWIWLGSRSRPRMVPTATVVHRSVHPTPPATPVLPAPAAVEPPPPPEPPDLPAPRPAGDETLDLPQAGD